MKISCDAIPNNCCGIYIIRNKCNNKIYIGQSIDIKRRGQEHMRSGQPEKYSKKSERDSKLPIHLAMQKYGIENFSIEILEKCEKEDLDNKEKYWISILHSNDKNIGYNITEGGQKSFGLKGEQHSQAKLKQTDVDKIINLLQNTDLTLLEIATQFSVNKSTISMINTGKTWKNSKYNYPIRVMNSGSKGSKNPQSHFTEQEVMEIRKLYSQGVTYKDLPEKYKNKSSVTAVRQIQYGKTYKHLPIWDNKQQKWIEPCIDYSPGLKD